jgi:hypothetical protein
VQGVIGFCVVWHGNVSICAGSGMKRGGVGVFLCCRFMFIDEVVGVVVAVMHLIRPPDMDY